MKKNTFLLPCYAVFTGFLVLAAGFSACDQSAIFYAISNEVEPKDPLIKGSPSKMVTFNGKSYVSNKYRLWDYDGSSWHKSWQPGDYIFDIAASSDALYAITGRDLPSELKKSTDGQNWVPLDSPSGKTPQSIFGAEDTLYACFSDTDGNYSIYYDNSSTLSPLDMGTSLGREGFLRGAVQVDGTYYLATVDAGIFHADDPAGPFINAADTGDKNITGVITVGSEILAVGSEGHLIRGDSTNFTITENDDYSFSGALTLWPHSAPTLLLLGGTRINLHHGYKEIKLDTGALPGSIEIKEPGEISPSSVDNKEKYSGSLGIRVVNHLHQVPYGDGTLFASTQMDGLWSYRNEWNAEE